MRRGNLPKNKYVDSILNNNPKERPNNQKVGEVLGIQNKKAVFNKTILNRFKKIDFFDLVFGSIGRVFRKTFFVWKFSLALLVLVSIVPLSAFEAHITNVTATIFNIDPPVITPPGGQYNGPVDIMIDDSDPDATHIFYTITPGTDPGVAPDPACGVLPGAAKPIGPITLLDDSVVKAIACDGPDGSAHHSLITTEIYDLTLKGRIEGRKYHDLDRSEAFSAGDTPIEGWQITLKQGTSTLAITMTDATGFYSFNDIDPGTYSVVEETRSGWQAMSLTSVSVVIDGSETEIVNFFNYDTGFACVPTSINFPANLAVQAAGVTVGNDDVVLAANVTINGNVRSNDEVEISGGGGNRNINGNVTVVNTISSGIAISGTTSTGASAVSLPNASINTWKSRAQQGGTVNGSFTFPNGTTGLVMGPTEIMGNLTLGSSNSLTVRGPIYVHGNLTIGSNSTINQDPAFGNQFTTIIVDGIVNIDSNITFVGSGATGTFLLISTHAAVVGAGAAIETSSNNSDLGDVVLYASDGDIHIRSNRTVLAAFAAHGTGSDSDDNAAILLDSNVTINYRTLPTLVSCGPRQPYESTSHVLINEFMPNPVGSDQGTAGAPLDGEWVEIFNPTPIAIDLAGYVLYDNNNTHALNITGAITNTGGTIVPSLGYLVVYRDGDADFEMNNAGGDSVRLFSAEIGLGGILVDSHTYVRDGAENKSFARVPDGSSNWIDPDSTPGEPNNFFFEILPGETDAFEEVQKPILALPEVPDPAAEITDPTLSEKGSDLDVELVIDPAVLVEGVVLGSSTTDGLDEIMNPNLQGGTAVNPPPVVTPESSSTEENPPENSSSTESLPPEGDQEEQPDASVPESGTSPEEPVSVLPEDNAGVVEPPADTSTDETVTTPTDSNQEPPVDSAPIDQIIPTN